ncbi:amino acid synthesis family protein [Verminephrobacter eiseniae]|uniref:amino acid synthesis family protein n=1 Tax=Verminephrobacter eiseniae TaxID=364317 RepID=UPI002236FE5F|nr:amino acid synthesis family protein [Verminephrobacter eiseniae]MCW5233712.1 amino acid synthesis family protein [Verminephrobacter eiseniae]MCW5294734.1 amino acid synthesis family protein [Verminephrobacter eiseniae]MCW8186401.1 amino acid synthesis family protein [Verminephrobacter eiseniae]MCW8224671.1 amino acid synthesis family protein [Verminephrobacter eiseniae]MCW8234281.1 amino acid synthesis family protein [Verminephrobacter eiseniae]
MIRIRRVFTQLEDIRHEFGPVADRPLLRGAIAAVLSNPYAGRYEQDILALMDALQDVGLDLARRLLQALAVPAGRIEGYGKGAIVGAAGEFEHGALWHVPGGYAMRELLGWQAERSADARSADGTKDTKGTKDTQGARGRGQGANALTIVPATKKVGAPGCALDVPLTHINASYVRSHFDTIELRVPGAPAADELIVILAMSTGPRIHARVGGLAAADISQWNGLR